MIDSDKTMAAATHAFNNILRGIQNSCLNYQIQMSPFSAVISLKKSLVRYKSGSVSIPDMNVVTLNDADDNSYKKDEDFDLLRREHEKLTAKYESAIKTIKTLEQDINNRDDKISSLEQFNELAQRSIVTLKKKIVNNKADSNRDKTVAFKEKQT